MAERFLQENERENQQLSSYSSMEVYQKITLTAREKFLYISGSDYISCRKNSCFAVCGVISIARALKSSRV